MKHLLFLLGIAIIPTNMSYGQDKVDAAKLILNVTKAIGDTVIAMKDTSKSTQDTANTVETKKASEDTVQISNDNISYNNFGWKDRFAFIIGGGVSLTPESLYDAPVVSKIDNSVIIEHSQKLRTSLTLGIVYTPKVINVLRYITKPKNRTGTTCDTFALVEYIPNGMTYAMFINPISLAKANDNSFTNSVDLGFGIGWRSGSFLIMATADFFSIKQPRQYFIDTYKDKNKSYIINGQTQTSIDPTDNNIFKSQIVSSFGIKLAYTFDIAKSFYSNSELLTKK
jgi:hypothetical protein